MATIKHHPLAKANVKMDLLKAVYGPGEKEFTKAIQGIIEQNSRRQGIYASSFCYRGVSYPSGKQYPRSPYSLHPDFWATVDDLIKQRDDLEIYEKPLVSAFVTNVLNSSDYWEDFLKVLPESLHQFIHERRFLFNSQVPTLDDAQVQLILARHAKGAQLLRTRLVWNLLL